MIKAGIVGGTGYAGVELLRLLAPRHDVKIEIITSRERCGVPVCDEFPNLRGHLDIAFSEPDIERLASCDVVFYATPHGVAMKSAAQLLARGVRVIDLSADYRLQNLESWERWYKVQHESPELVSEAVYGLPEVNRDAIREAKLVAVPGCYPTAVQLGYLPLLESGLVDTGSLIADAKSGVSGAGRQAVTRALLCEASESMSAYGVSGHRHLPEIEQGLQRANGGRALNLTFIPHLTPMIRGIHATLYSRPVGAMEAKSLQRLFEERYADEPFVEILPPGQVPATRNVKASNQCQMAVQWLPDSGVIVVLSVIDNLVKGASGQAVQNMNIMFGMKEGAGLDLVPVLL